MRFKPWRLGALVVLAIGAAALALVQLEPTNRTIAVHSTLGHEAMAARSTPDRAPAVAPATTDDNASPLPSQYAFLQTRNPFARGGSGNASADGPEAALVFHGVAEMGQSFTAFIEDMAAKRVLQLSTGDAVGRGRIRSIDIDSLQFDLGGKTRRIEIGQNLNGQTVAPQPPASQPAAMNPPAGRPPPGTPGTPPP